MRMPRRDGRRAGKTSMRPAMSLGTSVAIVAGVLACYAVVVVFAFRRGGSHGLIYALFAAPVAGVLIAPAVMALLPAYLHWVRERIWHRWQGRYYAFDDRQIRVVEARGQLWFSSADVHAALGIARRPASAAAFLAAERRQDDEIGEALSNAGLARLLARSTDARVQRFLLWAERDVSRPWRNKQDRVAGGWI